MSDPVLLCTNLTDSEFKQIYDLVIFPKYNIRENACFWVQPDLSIGCSNSYFFDRASDRQVETVEEFLQYIEQQKLLRTLQ